MSAITCANVTCNAQQQPLFDRQLQGDLDAPRVRIVTVVDRGTGRQSTQREFHLRMVAKRDGLLGGQQVGVNARVSLTREGAARMTLVDLGLPPGFGVMTVDLDAAVKMKKISRWELTGRQIPPRVRLLRTMAAGTQGADAG